MILTLFKNRISKILVVEDSYQRQLWFTNVIGSIIPTLITANVSDAIRMVQEVKFDLIFLDHDLDENGLGDSEMNTGYQVAKHIPGTINEKTEIIVHSMNPVGAQRINSVFPLVVNLIPYNNLIKFVEVRD